MKNNDEDSDWISLDIESPNYYECVFAKLKSGEIVEVWRASDGQKDIYTLYGSYNIIRESAISGFKRYKLEEKLQ
jgi:hypothetical protein